MKEIILLATAGHEEAHRHHIQYLYQPSISPRPNRIAGHHGDKQGSEQDHKFRNPFLLHVFGIRPIILYILLLPVKINKDSDKITEIICEVITAALKSPIQVSSPVTS